MAKFYGKVGYVETVETVPGVFAETTVSEVSYYGDVLKNSGQHQSGEWLNDNINVSNSISIVADEFAYQNFHAIRWVEFMGVKWIVKSVEVQRPRLILSIGGVYNG